MQKILCAIVLGFILLAFNAHAQSPRFQLLRTVRPQLKVPQLSRAHRRVILEQGRMVLQEIYAHGPQKIQLLGATANAHRRFAILQRNHSRLNNEEFLDAVSDIFISQRDGHTSFRKPEPLTCYTSFLPLDFKGYLVRDGQRKVHVSWKETRPEVLALIADAVDRVQLGDEVLTYNGRDIWQVVRANLHYGIEPNVATSTYFTLRFLHSRWLGNLPVPAENMVNLEFKRPNGTRYSVRVPWLSDFNARACPASTQTISQVMAAFDNIKERESPSPKKAATRSDVLHPTPLTSESKIAWKLLEGADRKTYGYLKISGFWSEDELAALHEVKNVLQGPLAATRGLIIDVRNNPGGSGNYPAAIIQMLTKQNIQPWKDRFRNGDANYYFATQVMTGSYLELFSDAHGSERPYTETYDVMDTDFVQQWKGIYPQPAVLLVNPACVSACDLFAALAQDNKVAPIWGSHETTMGAAGGTFSHDGMIRTLQDTAKPLGPFVSLPLDIDMGFAFSQFVRGGAYSGQIAESHGIAVDRLVTETYADHAEGNSALLEKIFQYFNELNTMN